MVNLGSIVGSGAVIAITIKAVDQFSRTFRKVDNTVTKTGKGLISFNNLLKIGALGAAAFATGLLAIGTAAIKSALRMQPIADGFSRLAENSDEFLKTLNDVTKGTVSNFDLMSSTNKALLLGLDQEALPSLFKNAAIVGRAAGRTTQQAIEDITIGIGRQSRLILDNLGIIIKRDDVIRAAVKNNESFRDKLDKISLSFERGFISQARYDDLLQTLSVNLSEAELKAGFAAAAIESLNEKAGVLGGEIIDDASTNLQQILADFQNMKDELGEELLPTFTEFLQGIIDMSPEIKKLLPKLTDMINLMLDLANAVLAVVNSLDSFSSAVGGDIAKSSLGKGGFLSTLSSGIGTRPVIRPGSFKNKTVGDAIIRPNGQIIETHPNDTLIATRSPGGITVNIGTVMGISPQQISRALSDELNNKVSL